MPINQPLSWELNTQETFVPISHEGKVVGFCEPVYAQRIVASLNEEERLQKALALACYDLTARLGGGAMSVDDLVQQYIAKAERPTSGTAIVAMLLQHRQEDLDLTEEEFAKFCDTFRLSRAELHGIYAGADIENNQLGPLSRILGMTVNELIDTWKGKE